jgi:hypothetical protein
MNMTQFNVDLARRRSRLAYELARVRVGAVHALLLTAAAAVVTRLFYGSFEAGWLTITAAVWMWLEWRGGALLRGGRIGAAIGFVALAMPLWAFSTCCRAGNMVMGADCCNMAGACAGIGVALGLTLAVFLARVPRTERTASAVGMGLALIGLASIRCGELLAGEAFGLLGGLAAGALASGVVVTVLPRARRAE